MLYRDVVEGVHRIEDSYTNWFIIEGDGRLAVVDAGVRPSWDSLSAALLTLGRQHAEVEALVLTHAHFDHIGFAERARSRLGVPVWVHENDVPLTKQPRQYGHELSPLRYVATQPKALRIVVSFLRTKAFWPQPMAEVRRYSSDGTLPVPGSPRIVFTPGHTLGHCSLHLPERDVVISGDALVTLDPYTGWGGPRTVARAATADSERALASLEPLAKTGAATLLPGHGEPRTYGVERAVEEARRAGVS